MKTKAFVCLHGLDNPPDGRNPGFSEALRGAVESRLGAPVLWKEVLWDDLLGSPDSFGTLDLALQTPALARAFYEGREGDAVRARVAEAVRAASAEAGGAPVVLVGHAFGAAIAYETLARGLAPEAKALVMLAPPMGLFNRPEGKGGRLPDDVSALSLRSPGDEFAETLEPDFPDVSEREVLPPPGTRGGANHRFYWESPDVAESVAAAAVRAFSDAGIPAETGEEILLLARAAEDSLWSAGEEIELDEDGNIIAITVS